MIELISKFISSGIATLVLSGIAIIVSIFALIVSIYFNKKSLEQSEKNTIAQITYKDKKLILLELVKNIKKHSNNYYKLNEVLNNFLMSPKRIFIPKSIINDINKQTLHLDQVDKANSPYPKEPEIPDEEIERHEQDEYEQEQSLSVYERFDKVFNGEIDSAVDSIIRAIFNELNYPIPKK